MMEILNRLLPIVALLLCPLGAKAQPITDGDMYRAARAALYEHFCFRDPNPTHQDEFEVCYQALGCALEAGSGADSLRAELFDLLYRNAADGDEDMIDGVRWAIRLGTLFTAIAMTSDEGRYRAFLLCADERLRNLPGEWKRYEIMVELAWLIKILEFEGRSSCELSNACVRIKSAIAEYRNIASPDVKFISDIESIIRYYMP